MTQDTEGGEVCKDVARTWNLVSACHFDLPLDWVGQLQVVAPTILCWLRDPSWWLWLEFPPLYSSSLRGKCKKGRRRGRGRKMWKGKGKGDLPSLPNHLLLFPSSPSPTPLDACYTSYLQKISSHTTVLLTKSEVITWKSQTEALMYWPSNSGQGWQIFIIWPFHYGPELVIN